MTRVRTRKSPFTVGSIAILALLSSLLVAVTPGVAQAELTDLPDETWGVVGVNDDDTTRSEERRVGKE